MVDLPELHPGDCRDTMAALAALGETFSAIVCDPPYHLTSVVKRFGSPTAAPAKFGTDGLFARQSAGFMNARWDSGDIAFRPETWRAAWELLPPGGYLAAFGGTRTFHRMAVAIEDAGFDIRDTLMWVYSSGFPKSHDVARNIDKVRGCSGDVAPGASGKGTETVNAFGNGLNVNFQQRPRYTATSADGAAWQGWGTALKPAWEPIILAQRPVAGAIARNVLTHGVGGINVGGCAVPAVGSRAEDWFPANLLHDGSAEVLDAFGDPARSRFFYCAKATKADRAGSRHPTVKPLALMEWLCRLVTPPGGRVLDPFAGSGTTLQAAYQAGFAAVGCEAEPEYCEDIRRRIAGLLRAPNVSGEATLEDLLS